MRGTLVALLLAAIGVATQAGGQSLDASEIEALEGGAASAARAPQASPLKSATNLKLPERSESRRRYRDLFSAQSWYTPPPPPPPRPVAPPPKPTAPTLPFAFMGSLQQGDSTVYFLARGDRAYDVKVGDVLDETYRVDGVSDGRLMFTYLPLTTSQALPIGEQR
jgi:hypothetical protein